MNAESRRKEIQKRLESQPGPLSASKLASQLGVSRQIIVGDIALLRASGTDITATPRGYILTRKSEGLVYRIPCRHRGDDMQRELLPLLGMEKEQEKEDFFFVYIKKKLGVEASEILSYDLFLTNMDEPELIGWDKTLLSSPRIDNLASVAAIVEAMCEKTAGESLAVAGLFDNEEIGSRSKQGADSSLMRDIIRKIGAAFGMTETEVNDMLRGGFLLSVDGAHAVHPNYTNKSDITNDVILGKGITVKTSASQRYLSDSEATAVVMQLCKKADIPYQVQVNRSGMPGGQTLGPIAVSYLPMQGADIGLPMLAMHSARELADIRDYHALASFLKIFSA